MQLTVEKLSKRYGRAVQALTNVDFTMGPGVVGLLGPNGAGKSTLMRILATITRPTSGRVMWNNADIAKDPDALRDVLGYLPQDFGVYPNLNAPEFLEYIAAVKGIAAVAANANRRVARDGESDQTERGRSVADLYQGAILAPARAAIRSSDFPR
jgi:ABC-2 type transport system ATP-binding protein